jgi:ATP-binding cassette subfamily B multidrug efflux pump
MHLIASLLFRRLLTRVGIFLLGVLGTLAALVGVFAQKRFIDDFQLAPAAQASTSALVQMLFVAALGLLTAQALQALCKFLFVRESTLAHRVLSEKVYEQTLALRGESRFRMSVGETVSLYAQDVNAVCSLFEEVLPLIAIAGVPLLAFPWALKAMEDLPVVPLLSAAGTSLIVCFFLAHRQARLFRNSKTATASRVAIINEWLQNMRAVRMLGWISHFEQKIFSARQKETRARLKQVSNGSGMNGLMQVMPYILNAIALTFAAAQPDVSAGSLVAALWLCGIFMVRPLRSVPWTIVNTLDALASARRLENYLAMEREPKEHIEPTSRDSLERRPKTSGLSREHPALRVRGLKIVQDGQLLLDNINFDVWPRRFVAIVGPVGSGKTILLHALLREIPCHFDVYEIYGQDALQLPLSELRAFFGFVPQDGFVMSANVRDNVAFTYGAPKHLDAQTLDQLTLSAFSHDLALMSEGLDTEIGERGVNLSGGQRQRLSLARTLGLGRDILLLDDCLSAVDVGTEKKLIDDLLTGLWSHQTRLLVTHRLSVLPHCDEVWTLEQGQLKREQQR